MNRQVLITRTKFWSFGVLDHPICFEFHRSQHFLQTNMSFICGHLLSRGGGAPLSSQCDHNVHVRDCDPAFLSPLHAKNHRGNVSTRIDHVQSGAKQSTPNPRKKGKENKTKQSKIKNSTTEQSTTNTTKIHQTFFNVFFRLGAKKKISNRNHASRCNHASR